jgi:hypothetical protein
MKDQAKQSSSSVAVGATVVSTVGMSSSRILMI